MTRLLVLGAVRIFQPAHGYLVMRELSTWQVDEWANLKPGSIYNALRSLTKASMLVEEPHDGEGSDAGSGTKTAYRLTQDGETEFQRLVRDALWQLHPHEPAWLMGAISFWWVLPRDEVIDALDARRAQLVARLSSMRYSEDAFVRHTGKPAHVAEHFRVQAAHAHGELEWVDDVSARIKEGGYWFEGEDPANFKPPEAPARTG